MFFNKKKCGNCGEKLDTKWDFCPYCGEELIERPKSIFEDIDEESEQIDKIFRPIKGVSIMISGGTGMKPNVEVENFGHKRIETKPTERIRERSVRIAKVTEEPETKIERNGNRQVIKINLPGVKVEDIEIKRLEQSIEVKAFTGDKAYFKLIPVPSNASVNRSFEDDMLKIEVQR